MQLLAAGPAGLRGWRRRWSALTLKGPPGQEVQRLATVLLARPWLRLDVRQGRMSCRGRGRSKGEILGDFFLFSSDGWIFDQEAPPPLALTGFAGLFASPAFFSTLSPLCLCRWQAEGRPNQSPTVSFPTRRLGGSAFNRKNCRFKWI